MTEPSDDAEVHELLDLLWGMFSNDEGFVGTALGQDTGVPLVLALVTESFDVTQLPESLGGMPVRPLVTGVFKLDEDFLDD